MNERKCCQCCLYCKRCQGSDFQKILHLKATGIVIYKHKINHADQPLFIDDVFIIQNTKNTDVSQEVFVPEFEKQKEACPRCKHLIDRTGKILSSFKSIKKHEIRSVCEHCRNKLQPLKLPCEKCEDATNRFMSTIGKLFEYPKTKTELKSWVDEQHILKHLFGEPPGARCEFQSEIFPSDIRKHSELELLPGSIEIETNYETTKRKLDMLRKENPELFKKLQQQHPDVFNGRVPEDFHTLQLQLGLIKAEHGEIIEKMQQKHPQLFVSKSEYERTQRQLDKFKEENPDLFQNLQQQYRNLFSGTAGIKDFHKLKQQLDFIKIEYPNEFTKMQQKHPQLFIPKSECNKIKRQLDKFREDNAELFLNLQKQYPDLFPGRGLEDVHKLQKQLDFLRTKYPKEYEKIEQKHPQIFAPKPEYYNTKRQLDKLREERPELFANLQRQYPDVFSGRGLEDVHLLQKQLDFIKTKYPKELEKFEQKHPQLFASRSGYIKKKETDEKPYQSEPDHDIIKRELDKFKEANQELFSKLQRQIPDLFIAKEGPVDLKKLQQQLEFIKSKHPKEIEKIQQKSREEETKKQEKELIPLYIKEDKQVMKKEKGADKEKVGGAENKRGTGTEKVKETQKKQQRSTGKEVGGDEKEKTKGPAKQKSPTVEKPKSAEKETTKSANKEKDEGVVKEKARGSDKKRAKSRISEKEEGIGVIKRKGMGSDKEVSKGGTKEKTRVSDKEEVKGVVKEKGRGSDKEEGKGGAKEKTRGSDKEEGKGVVKEKGRGSDKEEGKGGAKEKTRGSDKEEGKGVVKEKGRSSDKEESKGGAKEKTRGSDKEDAKGGGKEKTRGSDKEDAKGGAKEKTRGSDKEDAKGGAREKTRVSDKEDSKGVVKEKAEGFEKVKTKSAGKEKVGAPAKDKAEGADKEKDGSVDKEKNKGADKKKAEDSEKEKAKVADKEKRDDEKPSTAKAKGTSKKRGSQGITITKEYSAPSLKKIEKMQKQHGKLQTQYDDKKSKVKRELDAIAKGLEKNTFILLDESKSIAKFVDLAKTKFDVENIKQSNKENIETHRKKKELEFETAVREAKKTLEEHNIPQFSTNSKQLQLLSGLYDGSNMDIITSNIVMRLPSYEDYRLLAGVKTNTMRGRPSYSYLPTVVKPKTPKSDISSKDEKIDRHRYSFFDESEMIVSKKVVKRSSLYDFKKAPRDAILFHTNLSISSIDIPEQEAEPEPPKDVLGKRKRQPQKPIDRSGVISYQLSDPSFIDKGWTLLPVLKVLRKVNIYRMVPTHPEFDWFERNKKKGIIQYKTGEKLAYFNEEGGCRWYYRNRRLALDYYETEDVKARKRFVIYSNGEPDECGKSRPITILASFDYMGNGIVFDHAGRTRLKYNQCDGVVLDTAIGPLSHWKWNYFNDPPVLQQVMIDTHLPFKDPEILRLGPDREEYFEKKYDNDMLEIEFENVLKEKRKKVSSKSSKSFPIYMKALKVNENFSLRILDQAHIYLTFRDGPARIKINLGMTIDRSEIIDTDTAELGEIYNPIERLPAPTDSVAALQRGLTRAQNIAKYTLERNERTRPTMPVSSVDNLKSALSRPLRKPIITLTPSTSKCNSKKCSRTNLYYNTRI